MFLIDGPVTPSVISELIAKVKKNTSTGGHSLFLGQVRSDKIDGKNVKAIEYSAYDEMVKMEVDEIKKAVLSEFPEAESIEIIHSKGLVKAGEISLFVLVSSRHRHHAISACSKAVELIKEKLPIWKKEIFEDGSSQWRQNE
jgi:molybdopterin synthase catalytic subunit